MNHLRFGNGQVRVSTYRSGLTLVELLIVAAIVAILAALITVGIQAAIHAAISSACLQNLQSIGKAYSLYIEDHDGNFPPYFDNASVPMRPDNSELLVVDLGKYGADKSQFFCPLDSFSSRFDERSNYDHTYKSYAYSIGFQTLIPADSTYFKLNISALRAPSMTFVLTDSFVVGDHPTPYPQTGHGDQVNVLFADWHVKQKSTHGFDFGCTYPGQTPSCKEP